jgi:hypothetical protein
MQLDNTEDVVAHEGSLQPLLKDPASSRVVLMLTCDVDAQLIAESKEVCGIDEKQPAVARTGEMVLMLGYDGMGQNEEMLMDGQKVVRYEDTNALTWVAVHDVLEA